MLHSPRVCTSKRLGRFLVHPKGGEADIQVAGEWYLSKTQKEQAVCFFVSFVGGIVR